MHQLGRAGQADEASWRYRGWRIVAVLLLLQIAIFGFGLFGQGIYLAELQRLNGWSTGLIAAGSTLCLVLGSLLSMFSSDLLRWIGPRGVLLAGILFLAAGLVTLAFADTVLQLYAGFIALSLGWVGLGTITVAAIVGAWFERKRGLAISITFSGATLSGMLLMPGLVALVEAIGFRHALCTAAAISVIVLTPIVTLVIRRPRASEHLMAETAQASTPLPRMALLRDGSFLCLTASFACAVLVQVAIIVHQISILTPALGFQLAGGAVSLTTAMSLAGRIGLGVVADRIDPRRAAMVSILGQAAALTVMGRLTGVTALFVACAAFGLSMGNLITLPALIIQREYPPASFGIVLGLSMAIAGVINACGPAAMGLLRDVTGGYATPIFIGVAVQLASALAIMFAPRPTMGRRMG